MRIPTKIIHKSVSKRLLQNNSSKRVIRRSLHSTCASLSATSTSAPTPTPYVTQGEKTHFGYENVALEEKEHMVKKVFANVAESYDVMNDVMSLGIHRYWKDELCKMTALEQMAKIVRSTPASVASTDRKEENPALSILDVAGGTGDVAFRFVEACGSVERSKSSGLDPIQITICDINPSMLAVGERRAREMYGNSILDSSKGLSFSEGNAECLPFDSNQFDLYTIAFGLRNVTDVDQGLRDAYRVLKPGGRFMCLEFSHLTHPMLQAIYDQYSFHLIPSMGEFIANDKASYQYLVESIRKFSNQEDLKGRMENVGFENVSYSNFNQGIVAIHEGWKPLK